MKKFFAVFLVLTAVSFTACSVSTNLGATDTSVITEENKKANTLDGKNTYEYEGVTVCLPEEFKVDESGSSIIARPDSYPDKTDNIAFSKAGKDSAANYSKKSIEKNYKSIMSGFTGISRYEKSNLHGNDVIIITYGVKYDDAQMIQTQALVFLEEKSVVITYTSVSGSYDDEFEFSVDNLALAE